ncbi:MAG: ycdQ [Cytophagaceae bacterium]|jgi:cellulose synthase/poly-beta-1,6-N-acetylglucosamine synthase-like glycosyltransferase|nr:ycdQ [Cytophagaceae bacterium]
MMWTTVLYILLVLLLSLYFLLNVVIFLVLAGKQDRVKNGEDLPNPLKGDKPLVSVLIAARNEEASIIRCLQALVYQHYPPANIQILVGDDDSEDNTAALVKDFMINHSNIELVSIAPSTQRNLKGKTNVLATLFKKATGQFVFITDADIAVNPHWITSMLAGLEKKQAQAASGTTFVTHENNFHFFQTLEWMQALGFLYTADQVGIQVTAVGNNMVISKAAYDGVGGYEHIPFSVTEDLELYLALKKKNYKHRLFLSPGALAWTKPLDSLGALFKQRKRWLKGVQRTPWLCQFYMAMHAVFGLFIGAMCYFSWGTALFLYVTALMAQFIRIRMMCNITKVTLKKFWWTHLLVVDVYQTLLNVCLLIYFVLPTGVEWKKRTYV